MPGSLVKVECIVGMSDVGDKLNESSFVDFQSMVQRGGGLMDSISYP